VVYSHEHGNEPSDPIKDGQFLVQLSDFSASQEGLCPTIEDGHN
jgi:hypothetical protein